MKRNCLHWRCEDSHSKKTTHHRLHNSKRTRSEWTS